MKSKSVSQVLSFAAPMAALLVALLALVGVLTGCTEKPRSSQSEDVATSNSRLYSDDQGQMWRRNLIKEKQADGRLLLLAIDSRENLVSTAELPQVTVFRKSYVSTELVEMIRDEERLLREISSPAHPLKATVSNLRTNNPLWPIEKKWTAEAERDYAVWIQKNAREDMLKGTGVDADCAKFAIALRWIYAREAHLPAADYLASTGVLFGSWQSTEAWDKLPTHPDWKRDERFKKALNYLLQNTYTHSLFDDLYPVKISPAFVTGGTVYLTLWEGSGHTRTVTSVGAGASCSDGDSCISIIYGEEPATEQAYLSDLVPYRVEPNEGGFLRFRWPEQNAQGAWSLRAKGSMPGYSTEQYDWEAGDYIDKVHARLLLSVSPEERYTAVGQSLVGYLKERLEWTERAYFMCSLLPCEQEDPLYEEWSTPQRDHRLSEQIAAFENIGNAINGDSKVVRRFKKKHETPFFEGAPFTVLEAMNGTGFNTFDSDPTVDFFTRWGYPATPGADSTLLTMARIGYDNWKWRESLVRDAQALCFQNAGGPKSCDVKAKNVRTLSTERLDRAFRKFQAEFLENYSQAGGDAQSKVNKLMLSQVTAVEGCPQRTGGKCTMMDILPKSGGILSKMTSKPDDELNARNGIKN